MRILFTFAGGVGHFLPLAPIARAMAFEGHEVAFGAQFALLPALNQAGFTAFHMCGDFSHDTSARLPLTRVNIEKECQSAVFFIRPIGRERASAITDLAEEWKPDLLVCDELDYGCMIAAERLSIPFATILVMATGLLIRPELILDPLNELRAEHGLPSDPELAMLTRYLALSPFSASLRDPLTPLSLRTCVFRPNFQDRESDDVLPKWLAPFPNRPTVYVTLGMVFNVQSGDLFRRVLHGLSDLPINIIVTVGSQIDPAELGPQPENIRIERFIDQWALLPHCDLVVCHGGSGTVLGALTHGLPMLLLPMGADQPFNAQRCEALGVALALDALDVSPETLREAAARLLGTASHRQAAERIRNEITAMPAQAIVVSLLTKLARDGASLFAAN
jgi:UDP:flavonoid glycosyltransferase YjiC (YdhE family)